MVIRAVQREMRITRTGPMRPESCRGLPFFAPENLLHRFGHHAFRFGDPGADGASVGSFTSTRFPPSTSIRFQMRWRMAFSGLIHGPPLIAQPGQLCIEHERPSLWHSSATKRINPSHDSLRHLICGETPDHGLPHCPWKRRIPAMPAPLIARIAELAFGQFCGIYGCRERNRGGGQDFSHLRYCCLGMIL